MTVLLQMWVGPQRPGRQEFQMLRPANGAAIPGLYAGGLFVGFRVRMQPVATNAAMAAKNRPS